MRAHPVAEEGELLTIPCGGVALHGNLALVAGSRGLVVFAHGSGSSRRSPRNRQVAGTLRRQGLGTLLFDLLTEDEERAERFTGELRFDIPLLAERLERVTRWMAARDPSLTIGYFGASTGAAAALVAAASLGDAIGAVVSRGGRPDLALQALPRVTAPTLLVVGGEDHEVLRLNRLAWRELTCPKRLEIVEGATHLFEEPGALEQVESLAVDWFRAHLVAREDAGGVA